MRFIRQMNCSDMNKFSPFWPDHRVFMIEFQQFVYIMMSGHAI